MNRWNNRSVVMACQRCEGTGTIAHPRHRPTIHDPYPEAPCPDCDGEEHEPECEVCGYNLEIAGYDCLACDTIASLTDTEFARLNDAALSAAIMRAAAMRRREVDEPLPTASESTSAWGMV